MVNTETFIPIKKFNQIPGVKYVEIQVICSHCGLKQSIRLVVPLKSRDSIKCFKCKRDIFLMFEFVLVARYGATKFSKGEQDE